MKRIIIFVLAVAVLLAVWHDVKQGNRVEASSDATQIGDADLQKLTMQRMDVMPLAFTENQGQWDERVKFKANAGGATVWFTADGIYYQITRTLPSETRTLGRVGDPERSEGQLAVGSAGQDPRDPDGGSGRQMSTSAPSEVFEHLTIKASFVGANSNAEIVGEGMMEYKCNYFIGDDPSKWHTDVPSYKSITIENIYDGIDLQFYGSPDGGLAYGYSCTAGTDIGQVRLEYEGVNGIEVDESGRLIAHTEWGEIGGLPSSPSVGLASGWSEPSQVPGKTARSASRAEIVGRGGSRVYGLEYSTFLGGSGFDSGADIAIDAEGCAYVTGYTWFEDFPVQDGWDHDYNGGPSDAFVTKFSNDGSTMVFSTFLGGSENDRSKGIAVDASGNAYVTGHTDSPDFPMQDAWDNTLGDSYDVFATKLSADGNSLLYSTYIGGSDDEIGAGIALDASHCIYVTGSTDSRDFPTQNAFDSTRGAFRYDAFVTKLTPAGDALVYSTFLGGSYTEYGHGIAVDICGCAYVTGPTQSDNFPTHDAYDDNYCGSWDAFLTKFTPEGNSLVYSTYIGGSSYDCGDGVAADSSGCAYLMGTTYSPEFPAEGAWDPSYNEFGDSFVAKFAPEGNSLIYSTFLGGSWFDGAEGVAVDYSGCAYVVGWTESTDFPTQSAFDASHNGNEDAFVAKLSATGKSLIYSTYLGGSDEDYAYGIVVDASGSAYVTGETKSTEFPTQNPWDPDHNGGKDVFVVKLGCVSLSDCGDVDDSGGVDVDDVVYLIAYIFRGGPPPVNYESGDVDCSGGVDIDDVVYMIAFIFSGGNAPCDTSGDGLPDC